MIRDEIRHSFLLKQFHDFYNQIVIEKKQLREMDKEEGPEDQALSHQVWTRLYNLLEVQAQEAGARGGRYGAGYYREAQYAMVALADEIFLNLDWSGREAWKTNLLENKIFGTNSAGQVLFKKMVRLLKEQNTTLIELAAVYFWVLSLGFQGRFRGMNDQGRVEGLRQRLYSYIFRQSPGLAGDSGPFIPEAYAHTLSGGPGRKLPYIWRWVGIIGIIILAYLLVSHFLWEYWTFDLADVARRILNIPQTP